MADNEYLTTKEVAALLRLKERKVYDLAAESSIPCTRATGKLLFSREAVNSWLAQNSTGFSREKPSALFSGSHDPLLEWAVRESQCGIATLFDGSIDGSLRIANGEATAAALHISDVDSTTWNTQHVQRQHAGSNTVLLKFVTRSRGIVYTNNLSISEFSDISQYSIAARQSGAGSQIVFSHLLRQHGIDEHSLRVPVVARSEVDAVLAVLEGNAQCTLGLQSVAAQHRLSYLHILDESLDLLVDRRFWFEPEMQIFVQFCQSDEFKRRLDVLPGYQSDGLFSVRLNT